MSWLCLNPSDSLHPDVAVLAGRLGVEVCRQVRAVDPALTARVLDRVRFGPATVPAPELAALAEKTVKN